MGNVHRNNISDKFNQYRVFHTATGEEADGNVLVMNPLEDQAALAALFTYARVTPDARVRSEIWDWITNRVPQSRQDLHPEHSGDEARIIQYLEKEMLEVKEKLEAMELAIGWYEKGRKELARAAYVTGA